MREFTPASAAGLPSDPQSQATRLVDYLRDRYPQVNHDLALAVVRQISPDPEAPHATAKRLRAVLASNGVSIKHVISLQAASQMLHGKSWESIGQDEPKRLKILVMNQDAPIEVPDWKAAGTQLRLEILNWVSARPGTKSFSLVVSSGSLLLMAASDGSKDQPARQPVASVTPDDRAPDWLEGLHVCVEFLRRHVEEMNLAVLDGSAVVEICARVRDRAGVDEIADLGDLFNSELTLHRQDDPDQAGYELCRGDELSCWYQLDLAMEEKTGTVSLDDDGAWVLEEGRLIWGLETLRPNEIVPGQVKRNLSKDESSSLLHRYRLAKRIYSNRLPTNQTKLFEVLSGPNESYPANRHQILTQLEKQGITWEAAAEKLGHPGLVLEDTLPIGVFYNLASMLNLEKPSILFASPNRSQLMPLRDGDYIRALLPRVHYVSYRFDTSVDSEIREAVKEAVSEFGTSLQMRHGMFPVEPESQLPDLVYSNDPEDLIATLAEMNLVAYVGVQPSFLRVPANLEGTLPEQSLAFSHSLFLAIDKA